MPVELQPVVVADGHRFELRRFAGGAAAPGLLFLPALGVPAQKYDGFASQLAAAGIDVAVHEWRGLATSSWRAGRRCDWGYRELFTDLDGTLAALDAVAPRARHVFGGHSLGGQFAAMQGARRPERCAGVALIASGVPYPATFPPRDALGLRAFAALLPPLVRVVGHFPGRRFRFAGREAAGVMRDWAATARSGRYADYGSDEPLEARLARLDVPTLAMGMADDWLAPAASLRMLLDKLGGGPRAFDVLDAATLGTAADHFSWLRRPEAVVARLRAGWPVSS